ncbi:complement factor B-like isoform X1 [Salvelinus fontinalis]|uniref:complement factor B-like isoform X1 n=1 Tax=Salvelinus fontinalis TaxID=8038 RepID=UPI002484FFDB|nr:complement factor B-like isoform X1 [Salvelinus fontinalis]
MRPEILTLIYSLILCLVCTVVSSGVSVCSTDGMSIRGGEYSLSNGSNVGSELLYHCPDGYYPYPKRMHRCLGNNRWSPSPSRRGSECRVMTCPDPSELRNGEVSPGLLRYVVGDQTTYECHDGYAFAGSASRVCQSNGKWSGDTPICDHGSGHCRDPGVPPGAKRNGNMLDIGDRVSYECSLGLMLLGSKERICLEGGDWSGTEPVCYSKNYYDTPEEVSKYFSTSLENRLAISGLDDNTDGQQVQRSIQMRQGGKLHIYIALDNSGSISRDNFTVAKNCVTALINQISFFEVIPRYGILSFASEVNEIVDIFSPSSHSDMVLQNLNNVTYGKLNGTGSNLSKVFKKIHEKMAVFKERNELEDTQQAIIMFTDGKTNMGGSAEPTVIRIRNLMEEIHGKDWQKYLDIYVFGVGAEMNEEEINKLVSKKSSEKHFYKLRDDTKLTSLFKMIINESNSVNLCGLSWDRDGDDSTTSKRQEYPWVVTISVLVGNEHSSCMGALVTPRFVLTAAHCFREKQIDMIKVKVSDQEDMTLEQKPIIHPEYNVFKKKDKGVSEFYDYDVALLKLNSDVKRSKYIRPICIPCTVSSIRASGLHTSTTCKAQEEFLLNQNSVPARFMSEWKGQMYEKDVQIKLKEKRESCIKDAEEAEGIKNYKEAVTKNFLCTGGTDDKVEDIACKGDSGGALYLKNLKRRIQVGVISWGVKDLCMGNNIPKPLSTATTRDYHINLFRMQKFLKEHLGEKKNETNYEPLKFVD